MSFDSSCFGFHVSQASAQPVLPKRIERLGSCGAGLFARPSAHNPKEGRENRAQNQAVNEVNYGVYHVAPFSSLMLYSLSKAC